MGSGTLTSDCNIAQNTYNSIMCEGSLINNIITEFGVQVVVREVLMSRLDNDAYHTPIESYIDHRTTAFINSYTETDDEVKEGLFKSGDIVMNFRTSDEYLLNNNNRIWFDGKWWAMKTIRRDYSASTKFMIQVFLDRT
jgi:hypothetical protein